MRCYGSFVLIENLELKFALRKSRHLNFLYYLQLVFENNALHRTVSAIVGNESHTVEERSTA